MQRAATAAVFPPFRGTPMSRLSTFVLVGLFFRLSRYEELDRRMASPKSSPRNHFCYNSLTISI